MVKLSQRKEMAVNVVKEVGISIRLACEAFSISETWVYIHRGGEYHLVVPNKLLREFGKLAI